MPFLRGIGEFLSKIRVSNLDQRVGALPQGHATQIPGAVFGDEPVCLDVLYVILSIGMRPSMRIGSPGDHATRIQSISRAWRLCGASRVCNCFWICWQYSSISRTLAWDCSAASIAASAASC